MAAGGGKMVSNDCTMDGELISIDPDIRHREWEPILRNPAITPPPLLPLPPSESLVETSQLAALDQDSKQAARLSDASKLSIEELTQMLPVDLNLLSFLHCEPSVLDKVFPKRGFGGSLDPPTEYRESAKKMRAWRRLGMAQQRGQISDCQLETPQNDRSSYPSTGATQRVTTRKVTPTPEHATNATVSRKRTRATANTTQLATSTSAPSRGSAFQKRGNHEETATTTTHELPPQPRELLPSFEKSPPAGAKVPTPVKARRLLDCEGLVLDRAFLL